MDAINIVLLQDFKLSELSIWDIAIKECEMDTKGVVGSSWLHTGSFLITKLKLNQIYISFSK